VVGADQGARRGRRRRRASAGRSRTRRAAAKTIAERERRPDELRRCGQGKSPKGRRVTGPVRPVRGAEGRPRRGPSATVAHVAKGVAGRRSPNREALGCHRRRRGGLAPIEALTGSPGEMSLQHETRLPRGSAAARSRPPARRRMNLITRTVPSLPLGQEVAEAVRRRGWRPKPGAGPRAPGMTGTHQSTSSSDRFAGRVRAELGLRGRAGRDRGTRAQQAAGSRLPTVEARRDDRRRDGAREDVAPDQSALPDPRRAGPPRCADAPRFAPHLPADDPGVSRATTRSRRQSRRVWDGGSARWRRRTADRDERAPGGRGRGRSSASAASRPTLRTLPAIRPISPPISRPTSTTKQGGEPAGAHPDERPAEDVAADPVRP